MWKEHRKHFFITTNILEETGWSNANNIYKRRKACLFNGETEEKNIYGCAKSLIYENKQTNYVKEHENPSKS